MKRFNMEILVRPNPDVRQGGEFVVRLHETADTEHLARRMAMEHVWWNMCLVSRFLRIEARDVN